MGLIIARTVPILIWLRGELRVYFMDMSLIFIDIVFSLGLTLGVGSSTFALIFFIKSLKDGTIDQVERSFLHVVFTVLRIGMILIAAGLGGFLLLDAIPEPTAYLVECALLGVIVVNAILMDKRIMPMRFGPVIAGGSWYSMFLATKLPVYAYSYVTIVAAYIAFLIVFYFVFHAIKGAMVVPKV